MDGHLRTVPKKRTANFREDETKLLIQLWGNPLIQNKLFLTHRKAPVMRILAANMQQRGFYRTPDEIKTRIRNLKCLYHRIKRTMVCGTGLGTVDPDWPHFKAMDAILSKQGLRKEQPPTCNESLLEGPKCEDIKQEIEIDFNDDWTTNDSVETDYEESGTTISSPPPVQQAVQSTQSNQKTEMGNSSQNVSKTTPTVASFQIPTQAINQNNVNGIRTAPGSIPVPLLILNSMQPQQNQDKRGDLEISSTLKSLLEIQREHLEVEKQRLEMEKQKLEFERLIGTQMVAMLPMFGGLLQRISNQNSPSKGKREQGIKKYMMAEESASENEKDSENEDSGIHNDDSNVSSK
ncbi:myb/SANT-like DNA-binding domain-containing protein 1 isoform X2 [Onthophagus taurus]|uniref:myb/SANT-like DNA-binding domain-containing protein 1 isoform X2 n=1 Tax=Onthophagus taurus TaxID=166361 RepID=UPI0039BDB30E